MHRRNLRALLVLVVSAVAALGQTGTSMPSADEISELMSKAEEKVTGFEKALNGVKLDLDKVVSFEGKVALVTGAASSMGSRDG